jgi:LPXTG-site transpeptidase (sortase) family protein
VVAVAFIVAGARGLSGDKPRVSSPVGSESVQPSKSPNPSVTHKAKPSPTGKHWKAQACRPTGLSIPGINVRTDVLALGDDLPGRPAVPSNPTEVSWWKFGVVPGKHGNAAIQGHTWSQGDGVFDRLGELKRGDEVKIAGNGCSLTFVVDGIKPHVSPNLSAAQVRTIYRPYGPPGVTLVTCGDYAGKGVYHSRIVVHASIKK